MCFAITATQKTMNSFLKERGRFYVIYIQSRSYLSAAFFIEKYEQQ